MGKTVVGILFIKTNTISGVLSVFHIISQYARMWENDDFSSSVVLNK